MNSTSQNEEATAALAAMSDDELATFSKKLDTAVREARRGPQNLDLNDVIDVAATARYLLRRRRAALAAQRARAIVRDLLGAESE